MTLDVEIISKKDFEKMKKEKPFEVNFGFQESPFGRCLMAIVDGRICHISFVNGPDSGNLKVLESQWPGASLVTNNELTCEMAREVFQGSGDCKVLLKGTLFEANVWQALMSIPKGTTMSYEDIAQMSGHGTAIRAAANAVAKNPVAYLVPCHRVIRKDGSLHKYQWGSHVKKQILDFENESCGSDKWSGTVE